MSDTKSSSSSGIGFTGLLTIVFITLKLTNYIDWSWWWVLSPIWIIAGIIFAILAVIGVGLGSWALYQVWDSWRTTRCLRKEEP